MLTLILRTPDYHFKKPMILTKMSIVLFQNGNTALILAAAKGYASVVHSLLGTGDKIDINYQTKAGELYPLTPESLHLSPFAG